MRLLDWNSMENSRHGITVSYRGPSKTIPPRWNNVAGCSYSDITPVIEFTAELQSNDLTYHKPYTKRQQITYNLIKHLHDVEGWGYRVIARKMNSWGIKTQRGKTWSNSSVHSVLKRRHQRDLRIEQIRNQHFPTKISKFEVNYCIFD